MPDRVVEGNPVDEVAKLKAQSGQMIALHSGASLVVPLLEVGLIDELLLFVSPAAIGDGKLLFAGLTRELGLELIGSQVFDGSVVLLRYRASGPTPIVGT